LEWSQWGLGAITFGAIKTTATTPQQHHDNNNLNLWGNALDEVLTAIPQWCCTEWAVQDGLCEDHLLSHLIVDPLAVQRHGVIHHKLVIPYWGAFEKKLGQQENTVVHHATRGRYLLVLANCNDHGAPVQVTGSVVWTRRSSHNVTGSGSSSPPPSSPSLSIATTTSSNYDSFRHHLVMLATLLLVGAVVLLLWLHDHRARYPKLLPQQQQQEQQLQFDQQTEELRRMDGMVEIALPDNNHHHRRSAWNPSPVPKSTAMVVEPPSSKIDYYYLPSRLWTSVSSVLVRPPRRRQRQRPQHQPNEMHPPPSPPPSHNHYGEELVEQRNKTVSLGGSWTCLPSSRDLLLDVLCSNDDNTMVEGDGIFRDQTFYVHARADRAVDLDFSHDTVPVQQDYSLNTITPPEGPFSNEQAKDHDSSTKMLLRQDEEQEERRRQQQPHQEGAVLQRWATTSTTRNSNTVASETTLLLLLLFWWL
jgi:hypothetical protein